MSSKSTGSRSPQIETELQTVTLDDNLSRLMAGQPTSPAFSLDEIAQVKERYKHNKKLVERMTVLENLIKDAQKT